MDKETYENLLKDNKVVVLQFMAEWCNPCKMITPLLERACKEKAARLVQLDVENEDNIELAKMFNVRSLPYLVRFEEGKVTGTIKGFMGERYVNRFVEGNHEDAE